MFDFLKKEKQRPRALAFVDFENWYITLDNAYKMRPDVRGWHDALYEHYDVVDVSFFADFSNPALRAEISKIREVSNTIIETQNSRSHIKKDFTDFIMLDHIYQKALTTRDVDVFILFTGDEHFSSVANFLRTKCRKKVVVFGPDEATSTQLKNCADQFIAVPTAEEIRVHRKKLILDHIAQLYEEKDNPRIVFGQTVKAITQKYDLDQTAVTLLIHELVEEGVLVATKRYYGSGKFAKFLSLSAKETKKTSITNKK